MASAAAAAHGARVGNAVQAVAQLPPAKRLANASRSFRRRPSFRRYGSGVLGHVAHSQAFTFTTLGVIMVNALWIAIDTQWNHEKERGDDGKLPLEPYSTVIEHLFCSFFTLELVLRFIAFRHKVYIFTDKPFLFDGFLVLCMMLETWFLPLIALLSNSGSDGGQAVPGNLTVLRLSRLVRLTRMTRIMRSLPELMTLIRGMASAFKAVGSILVFLLLVMYVFAIVFTSQVTGGSGSDDDDSRRLEGLCGDNWGEYSAKRMFGSMGSAMMTLFTNGVLLDNLAPALTAIREESIFLQYLFMFFMVMSALTLLNMLIGVLCEVINKAAREESDQGTIMDFKANLQAAFKLIDTSEDGMVTRAEWSSMSSNADVRKAFIDLGFDELHLDERLIQMQETLFGSMVGGALPASKLQSPSEDIASDLGVGARVSLTSAPEPTLSFEQFVEKILEFRPDQPASALDVELLKEHVRIEELDIMRRADIIDALLAESQSSLGEEPQIYAQVDGEGVSRAAPAVAGGTGPQTPHRHLPTVLEVPQASGSEGFFLSVNGGGSREVSSFGASSSSAVYTPAAGQSQEHAQDSWLRQVPTELLFHHLKTRRPPQLLCKLEDI